MRRDTKVAEDLWWTDRPWQYSEAMGNANAKPQRVDLDKANTEKDLGGLTCMHPWCRYISPLAACHYPEGIKTHTCTHAYANMQRWMRIPTKCPPTLSLVVFHCPEGVQICTHSQMCLLQRAHSTGGSAIDWVHLTGLKWCEWSWIQAASPQTSTGCKLLIESMQACVLKKCLQKRKSDWMNKWIFSSSFQCVCVMLSSSYGASYGVFAIAGSYLGTVP